MPLVEPVAEIPRHAAAQANFRAITRGFSPASLFLAGVEMHYKTFFALCEQHWTTLISVGAEVARTRQFRPGEARPCSDLDQWIAEELLPPLRTKVRRIPETPDEFLTAAGLLAWLNFDAGNPPPPPAAIRRIVGGLSGVLDSPSRRDGCFVAPVKGADPNRPWSSLAQ